MFQAKIECPNLYANGKETLINMILEYYSVMGDEYPFSKEEFFTKEEFLDFDDDELIVEIGFCTMFR